MSRATALERAGDIVAAARCYEEILEHFPGNRRARAALQGLTAKVDGAMQGHVAMIRRMLAGGQVRQAREMAENLALGAPGTATVLVLLGEARLASGDGTGAIRALEDAAAKPAAPATRMLLGTALHRAGRSADAAEVFRALLAADPGNAPARLNLCIALAAAGQDAAAIAACREAVTLMPDNPELQLTLGNLLRRTGDPGAAEGAYEAALVLRPDFPPVLHNLAGLLLEQARPEEALVIYDRLLALGGGPADLLGRARALSRVGQFDAAAEAFAQVAEALPGDITPLLELGHLKRETGDATGAEAACRAALQHAPERGILWEALALVHDFTAGDPLLAGMEAALAGAGEDRDGCGLHFALARARSRTGDTAGAFLHYAEGNRIRRALLGYDPQADRDLFATLQAGFASAPPALEATGTGPTPVFILGMPRSGTSLVEQILAAHPEVHAAGELPTLHGAVRRHLAATLSSGAAPGHGALAAVRAEYLAKIRTLYRGRSVVTDKTPTNFLWIGAILAALPEARILHVTRDAMATGWSCFTTNFSGSGHGFSCDLTDTGHYIRDHDRLMAHWRTLYPGRIVEVDYDALTLAPEDGMRAIVAAAGLDWSDACLDFAKVERRVATASALQVREGVYRGSSEEWRRYADHIAPLEAALSA